MGQALQHAVAARGGAIERGGRPMSHLDFKLAADFEQLAGWQGGSGFVNPIQDHGGKMNALQVGSRTGISNIEVPVNTHRLLHAWLQQEFADGRASLLAGLYALTEKTPYRAQGGADLAGFRSLSGTDGDSTANRRAFNPGIRVKALLPGRGDDVFGLAYTRASLSGKWRGAQLAAGNATTSLEDAWEAADRIQAGQWLAVQPVFQRIDHPGGLASRAAAGIVGARVEVSL